jgi:enoyl-CoA hydratase/carnithine racemase
MMHSCEAAFKDAKANDSIKVILFTRAGGAFPLGRDINATAPGGAIA